MELIPLMDKDAVRYITQNLTPEETEYVAGISQTLKDTNAPEEIKDDIIFVNKLIAFSDKFQNLHWAADNLSYHTSLNEFRRELEIYKDDIAENIQSIIGQFNGNQFTKLELPIGENPLDIINELKMCVHNWFELHKDDIEYEGCRNSTSAFIETIHKYVYIFRLCKISTPDYTPKY